MRPYRMFLLKKIIENVRSSRKRRSVSSSSYSTTDDIDNIFDDYPLLKQQSHNIHDICLFDDVATDTMGMESDTMGMESDTMDMEPDTNMVQTEETNKIPPERLRVYWSIYEKIDNESKKYFDKDLWDSFVKISEKYSVRMNSPEHFSFWNIAAASLYCSILLLHRPIHLEDISKIDVKITLTRMYTYGKQIFEEYDVSGQISNNHAAKYIERLGKIIPAVTFEEGEIIENIQFIDTLYPRTDKTLRWVIAYMNCARVPSLGKKELSSEQLRKACYFFGVPITEWLRNACRDLNPV